ncbi:MAG: response regulator transcription factor [Prolixibacteraceae bacterium]|nr:response regulator transcription factor [Prolixibacteraceae bacterium]
MNRIKVLLVDDHQLIIDGLKSLLKNTDEIVVAAEANNGREALRILDMLEIDVVLMDIDMPVMNGIDTLKEMQKLNSRFKVIILSMHQEAGMIKSLMSIGAHGYLLKSCAQDELISAIRKVAAGQQFFSPEVTLSLLNPTPNNPLNTNQPELLTDRETEILKLIAEGFSNKEIGSKLFISHRTVDTHRTNLMKKLNSSNIAGLISYAIKNGIV